MQIAARQSFLTGRAPIGPVPIGYRLVKYITRASGNVWFPTGIYNDSSWGLNTVARFPGNVTQAFIFGAYYANTDWQGYGLIYNYGQSSRPVHGNKYGGYFGNTLIITDDNNITCDCSSGSCVVVWNGVSRTATSPIGFNSAEIFLLGNGYRTAGVNHGMGETTITRNGEEVAHLFPCIRESDNTPVFWDSIAQAARSNTGTGTPGVVELT